MKTERCVHTATLLPDGKVMICGGWSTTRVPLDSTEIYDPATNEFTAGPTMSMPRAFHTATILPDGDILVTGGVTHTYRSTTNTTEIYSVKEGTFKRGPSMIIPRDDHCAVLLTSGKIWIGGGSGMSAGKSTEIFDPVTNKFEKSKYLLQEREGASAALVHSSV